MEHIKVLNKILVNTKMISETKYEGDYFLTNTKKVTFVVCIPEYFPVYLPDIYIKNFKNENWFLPHIEQSGLICYSSTSNIVVNEEQPMYVLSQCIKKAIDTVKKGLEKNNYLEFRKEFNAFWDSQPQIQKVYYLCESHRYIKRVDVNFKDNLIIIKDSKNKQLKTANRIFGDEGTKSNIDAYVIPLRENTIVPPNPQKGWNNKEFLKQIRENITSTNKREFDKIIKKKRTGGLILLLNMPIHEFSNNILIGNFYNLKRCSIKQYSREIIPINVSRFDNDYLIDRTSGEKEFLDFNVAIIGVGSVGSKLANELGSIGIGKMTLIDKDIFEIDNLYRHSLGAESIKKNKGKKSCNKVDLLKEQLEERFPYMQVEVEATDVLYFVNNNPEFFKGFDYIFVCIGETMPSIQLNKLLFTLRKRVFYSWLEPMGIGGHVLYINSKDNKKGCFNCLYTSYDTHITSNRASFVEEGQYFEKSLASCRSKFVPYNSITSSEAALKTMKIFYEVVVNKMMKNTLYSWVGETTNFIEKGYKFSERFNDEEIRTSKFNLSNCRVCGDKDDKI
ncbi:ThiF family adenylyltransferase [Staphylococcus simulans]|uniref:ThiF family adenylyltransferase n=1 Tax=Staphylococcus simulans TaxID=1286 RepID=UPI001304864B|nr:ThiF family adenylyltransferase [Staphylococcus simulans]MDY5060454.1 ThiF family adenylyltransferase [Staphylococcus simulans]